MTKILIALATYNERDNLPELLDEIRATVPEADLLIVDDSSPDGTGDYVQERMKGDSRLHLLSRAGKQGLGTAVLAAIRFGLENDYDYIINMDADGSHPPQFLPFMLETAQGERLPDVVIGSRYVPGGKIIGWPLRRRLASRAVNAYARFVLRLATHDNSGAYRCYRADSLKRLDFSRFQSKGYSFFEEILFRLRKAGARFEEIPITFVDRLRGQSKINMKEAITALLLLWRLR